MIILSVVGLLVIVFLVAALFARRDFVVERELLIDSSKPDVFSFLKYLKNHTAFSKWTTKDEAKKVETKGVDGLVGFVQPWHNFKERAGVGELEIKRIIEGSEILLEHRYFKPVKGLANTLIITESRPGDQTRVKWIYQGFSNYPINLLTASMNMDKIVGKDLEVCLMKLKSTLEEKALAQSTIL
ncbi:MAG: SRPBCC family protein [Bacteroidota bacterium]